MSCARRSFWIPLGQSHMTHIRIIGNSHVGSLKWAIEPRCSPPSDLKVTFIAHRGARMGRLVVDGNALVPNGPELRAALKFTSGGLPRIVPADYDDILVYGMLNFYRPPGSEFSAAVLAQDCEDHVTRSVCWKLAGQIRQMSSVPVYAGHAPMPAVRPGVKEQPADVRTYDRGVGLIGSVLKVRGVELVGQPEEALCNGLHSRASLARRSRRLEVGGKSTDGLHSKDDRGHMNDKFGALYLQHVVHALSKATQ